MIVFPDNWETIGQPIDYIRIQDTLCLILTEIGCRNLSLSGGLDSSYMLYCMTQVFGPDNIHSYTVVGGKEHPDYVYSKMITDYFKVKWHPWILLPDDYSDGDLAIRAFYDHLTDSGVNQIIACDGIDEYMCGYYAHQDHPNEDSYRLYLSDLRDKHLIPLDKNSFGVSVFLPYLDNDLVGLYSQIPVEKKVDHGHRKKVMMNLANGKIPVQILERRKYGFCDAGLQDRKEKGGSENGP